VIVTCERCSTQFRLDDSRIPRQGARVRCSRCKHAFRVEVPVSDEDERIQRAAEQALESKTPPATQDLVTDEEDWEFNDARPSGQSDAADAEIGSAVDVSEALGADDVPEFADPSAVDLSGGESDGDLPLADASETEFADASADVGLDLSGGDGSSYDLTGGSMDDYGPPPGDEHGMDASGGPDIDEGLGGSASTGTGSPGIDLSSASAGSAEAASLGDPPEWDFMADDKSAVSAQTPRAAPRIPQTRSVQTVIADEEGATYPAWLSLTGRVVGWCVVGAALAFGVYSSIAAPGPAAVNSSLQVAGLSLEEMTGRWIDNFASGDLYVVSGVARYRAGGSAEAIASLSVRLLDSRGEPIKRPMIPVGVPVPEALLRTSEPSALHRIAQALPPFAPGEIRQIQVVLADIPASARSIQFVSERESVAPRAPAPASSASSDSAQAERTASGEIPSDGTAADAEAASVAVPEGSGQRPATS
jgi:predicted Zn finger-like uncharacterized protein